MKIHNSSSFFSLVAFLLVQTMGYCQLVANKESARSQPFIDLVNSLSSWDKDKNSPLWLFKNHSEQKNVIISKEAMIEMLVYAEDIFKKNRKQMSDDEMIQIDDLLDLSAEALANDNFDINKNNMRRVAPIIKVREKFYVLRDAKFFDEVKFKDEVIFEDNVKFKKNVSIAGALSVNEVIANSESLCDLSVGCDIFMVESTDLEHGNIIKAGAPFIHTFPAGSGNTFVGENAGNFTMTGGANTVVGQLALVNNTTGDLNAAFGDFAMFSNTSGSNNTAIGDIALALNTTGSNNTAVGEFALFSNATADDNVAVGNFALISNTIGTQNTAVGRNALNSNNIGNNNVAVGTYSLNNNDADNNTAVGFSALSSNVAGSANTALGNFALANAINDGNNTAVGDMALLSNNGGVNNTAVGQAALIANTTGSSNVAVGFISLNENTTGNNNVSLGVFTGGSVGDNNTWIGNMTGFDGSNNVAVGFGGLFNAGGDNNVAVGFNALNNLIGTSSSIIAIGSGAGNSYSTGTENNNIVIGNGGVIGESGAIRIGDVPQAAALLCFIQGINGATTGLPGTAVLVDANGQLGTISSSRNVKDEIQEMGIESASIYDLNPVTFIYKSDALAMKQYGLIAEEVDQILPSIVIKDQAGQPFTVQYHVLPVLLLNEMIKQNTRIEELEKQEERIEALENMIENMNRLMLLGRSN